MSESAARPSLRISIPVAEIPPAPAGPSLVSPTHLSRAKAKAKRSRANNRAAVAGAADDGPAGETPPAPSEPGCVFKGYSFTLDPPPETAYDFGQVPHCRSDLAESVLLRPSSRWQWFVCLEELESLAKESLDRRAARLGLPPPSGLPALYIADRMDIDDPLWGYQVRSATTGGLQGFITLTVFTTWTHFFEWDSLSERSGMAAARVANSLAGKPDPALELLAEDSTVAQLAARVGAQPSEIVQWNLAHIPQINATSRILSGTEVYVRDPVAVDTVQVKKKGGETVRALAARLGLAPDDLILLNAQRYPDLVAATKLPAGTTLSSRDRGAEPDVFLPTGASRRALDQDGALAAELQRQERYGDPTSTGVVWPRVVEIGLLAGLGCGKVLVRLALEELAASGRFDFVVLQATMASVSFYEEMGFARVGAVARYASEGTPLAALPLHGYRHWASADEAQLEQFGDISYMMALRLSAVQAKGKARPSRALAKRLVTSWPELPPPPATRGSAKSTRKVAGGGNHAGIEGGTAIKVGDLALNMADGDDARLQLCLEVDRIVDARVGDDGCEMLRVKWRHCAAHEATWERAGAAVLLSGPAKAAVAKFRKQQRKQQAASSSMHAALSPRAGRHARSPAERAPADAASSEPGPWWAGYVARSLGGRDPPSPTRGRIFHGGLGEPNAPLALPSHAPDAAPPAPLEREHRFWYIVGFEPATHTCTVLPLLSAGRFGGCGRRAGRMRWRTAERGQGHERQVPASCLQLVSAESVTGARESGGEAFAIDEPDVEQAAREQAAAVRNKRRSLLSGVGEPGMSGVLDPHGRAWGGAATRKRRADAGGSLHGSGRALRMKKQHDPAGRACLACTKGKHTAHTCGLRGKAYPDDEDEDGEYDG